MFESVRSIIFVTCRFIRIDYVNTIIYFSKIDYQIEVNCLIERRRWCDLREHVCLEVRIDVPERMKTTQITKSRLMQLRLKLDSLKEAMSNN